MVDRRSDWYGDKLPGRRLRQPLERLFQHRLALNHRTCQVHWQRLARRVRGQRLTPRLSQILPSRLDHDESLPGLRGVRDHQPRDRNCPIVFASVDAVLVDERLVGEVGAFLRVRQALADLRMPR